jgi:hypothetical protein
VCALPHGGQEGPGWGGGAERAHSCAPWGDVAASPWHLQSQTKKTIKMQAGAETPRGHGSTSLGQGTEEKEKPVAQGKKRGNVEAQQAKRTVESETGGVDYVEVRPASRPR